MMNVPGYIVCRSLSLDWFTGTDTLSGRFLGILVSGQRKNTSPILKAKENILDWKRFLMSIMLILIRLKTCTITGEIAFPRNWIHFHKQENADENILAGTGRRCLKMGALPVASNNQTAYCAMSHIFIS